MCKSVFLFFLLALLNNSCSKKTSYSEIKRDYNQKKDYANVFWNKEYTLFDLSTDEPILPVKKNGQFIYEIYYSSNEDPNPYYGKFTNEQLERLLYYKFKNKKNCLIFCNAKKKKN